MATQNHVTKRPITTGNAVRKAGTAQADDAAKLAKKVEDQEAQQLAQAEQAGAVQEVSAMTVAQAEAAGVAAAEGSIGAVSAEAAAGAAAEAGAAGAGAAGAAAGAAAVSPAVIGAAALGVVAVAAAAGGGSSGGGSSSSNNGLATDKPGNNSNAGNNGNAGNGGNNSGDNGDATDKPTEPTKPAEGQKPTDQPKPADDPKPTEDPKPADQPKPGENSTPGEQPNPAEQPKLVEQPAEAKAADNGQPLIAESGDTKLGDVVAKLFEKAAGEGKTVEYIRIGHIVASEGQIEADNETGPRVFREVEVPAGKSAPTTKAETGTVVSDNDGQSGAAGAAKTTTVITAYEVVKTREPVTLEQAREMAQKMGGQLAVIDDADEAKFLAENLRGTMGHQSEGTGGVLDNSEAAWIASSKVAGTGVAAAKLDAMIRTGNNTQEDPIKVETIDFTGDKLSRFVVEYPDYKSPLTLNGNPVVDGQIINKDEFARLVWDSSRSARGQITYEAVDSNDAKTAKPLEGAQKQTLTLTESADIKHTMAPETPAAPPAPPAPPAPAGQVDDTGNNNGGNGQGNSGSGSNASGNQNQSGNTPRQGDENNQTVTKPVYPESKNQPANVDHDKVDAALNKSLFTGTDPDKHPAFIKITGINEAGDTKDESALYLRKVDASEVVTDKHYGDPKNDPFIVAYEDFDKLKWDSAQNTGGTFKFQALDANKQPIGDEQTVTINEAPAKEVLPPSSDVPPKGDGTQTPANPGNGQKPGDTTAEDPKKQPGTSEEQNQGNSGSGNGASENQNQSGSVSGQGGNVSGQTGGDSGQTGGTSGQSGNNQNQGGTPPVQNEQQTPEKPAASEDKTGEYPENAEPVKVAHNAESTSFDKAVFGGAEGKEPAAVRILHVKGSGEGDVEGLFKLVDGNPVAVKPNDLIKQADFDKLVWNAQKGDGTHTITFVPVKADGTPIASATEHTVTVQEAAAAPTTQEPPQQGAAEPKIGVYGDATTINLTHDQAAKKIDASVFIGNQPDKAPDAVKILSVEMKNPGNGDKWEPVGSGKTGIPAFGKDETYDGNLLEGKFLDRADFGNAQWNAAFDSGSGDYRVRFQAVTADHKDIQGATVQTINIHEAAENPEYPEAHAPLHVAKHDGNVQIEKAIFDGSAPNKAPMYVRITNVVETNGGDGEHTVLYVRNSDTDTRSYKASEANDADGLILSADQLMNLHWDAAHNEGGSFKFKPLGGDMKDIKDSVEQTVTVTEAKAEQPPAEVAKIGTYDETTKTVPVAAHDAQDTSIASKFFAGTNPDTAPDFVKIISITAGETDVTDENNGLYKEVDGEKTQVKAGETISKAEFDKLHWDALKGGDGTHTIEFTPVKNAAGEALDTATKHSFTVVEPDAVTTTPPAPHAPESQQLEAGALFNQPPMLKSVDTHTVISDSTNLLDDQLQHNLPLV